MENILKSEHMRPKTVLGALCSQFHRYTLKTNLWKRNLHIQISCQMRYGQCYSLSHQDKNTLSSLLINQLNLNFN